jgi:diaminohydroxyphosphoribosylaminopyrimidine deaminase/5-amino-6-(5-phosphoribosylamino)uracil reductase
VIGVADPNPVAAGGAAVLRTAGVDVDFVQSPESMRVNEAWLHSMHHGRPFVTLKLATSLDGRVAGAAGEETSISNQASRQRVHALRARVDAVLVGTNTAEVDDPRLNVRLGEVGVQPLRFVMGERDLPGHLWMFTEGRPAEQLRTRDPHQAVAELHERHIRHLLLEGGAILARAFLEAGLVDECIWITAPKVFGRGPTALGAPPLDAVLGWTRQDTVDVEGDLWNYLRPV